MREMIGNGAVMGVKVGLRVVVWVEAVVGGGGGGGSGVGVEGEVWSRSGVGNGVGNNNNNNSNNCTKTRTKHVDEAKNKPGSSSR